jgi:DNA end-binding protein Ku
MAGATLWKGYIHFNGTDLPVKLHTAVREERVQFHLLHASDQARLRQQLYCSLEKQPVPAGEQARGFELEEGKYLIVDPAELEAAAPESSRAIEVHEFVRTGRIDPLLLERAYFLEPDADEGGYGALASVLESLDVAGICTWSMRKRQYLGALQADKGFLRLSTLRYSDELAPLRSLELREVSLSDKEREIAGTLIDQLTAPFEPRKFVDEHQKKLRQMIEQKARGEKIAVVPPRRLEPTHPDQLLQALEASLKKAA